MGQHRRFPASFLIVLALLAIPSVLFGLVNAAENADHCAAAAQGQEQPAAVTAKGLKCE